MIAALDFRADNRHGGSLLQKLCPYSNAFSFQTEGVARYTVRPGSE
jgi:hypothetical protein